MSTGKIRGGWLETWMYILLIANIGALLWQIGSYLLFFTTANGVQVVTLVYALPFFANIVLNSWNIACLGFLFKWRKWGFFGLFGSTLAAVTINFFLGASSFALLGFFSVGLLAVLIHSKWSLFQ